MQDELRKFAQWMDTSFPEDPQFFAQFYAGLVGTVVCF